MNILIYSLGKSGTTALLYSLASATGKRDLIFEPRQLKTVDFAQAPVLVKSINAHLWEQDKDYFSRFEKKILLLRNPLDRIVSNLLYLPYNGDGFSDDRNTKKYLEYLQGLCSGTHHGIRGLDEMYAGVTNGRRVINLVAEQSKQLLALARSEYGEMFFDFKYEDFVSGNVSHLNDYLGFEIDLGAEVGKGHKRTKRAGRYDDYKRYFSDAEISEMRELFGDFASQFDYEFSPGESEPISLQETYEYTLRVINEYRRSYKLPAYQHGRITVGEEGVLFDRARRDFQNGKLDEAEKKLEKALSSNGDLSNAVNVLRERINAKRTGTP